MNAVPAQAVVRGKAAPPLARRMLPYIKESQYECIRMLRMPMLAVPLLIFPIFFYAFFAVILQGAAAAGNAALAADLFVSYAVYGIIAPGMLGFGIVVASEREFGFLALKRAVPMPPSAYLAGKMLMAVIVGLFVTIIIALIAVIFGHVQLSFLEIAGAIAAIVLLGSMPFCAIGLFIGTSAGAQSAPALVNLLYLPIALLSGVFFDLPGSLLYLGLVSPAFHLNQLVNSIVGLPLQGNAWVSVVVLTIITVACFAAAIRKLSRGR